MRNIQIIANVENCTYSKFSISDDDYRIIFPEEGQGIEFNIDLEVRLNKKVLIELNKRILKIPIEKQSVSGIDGTVFYNLDEKRKYYPAKKEKEMKTLA